VQNVTFLNVHVINQNELTVNQL